jgi:hypothetical protein
MSMPPPASTTLSAHGTTSVKNGLRHVEHDDRHGAAAARRAVAAPSRCDVPELAIGFEDR